MNVLVAHTRRARLTAENRLKNDRSSGGVGRGRMTREGSRLLRWIMVEAAYSHIRYDTNFTRAYHGIAYRRGGKVAIVALDGRLSTCCYAMLRDGKPFTIMLSPTSPLSTSSIHSLPHRMVFFSSDSSDLPVCLLPRRRF